MKRSIILLFFSVLVFGCQSMPHEQEPTVLVDAQREMGAAERLLAKTAHFFRPSHQEKAYVATAGNPAPSTFSVAKPPYSQQAAADPAAMHVPIRPKSSLNASQMLFNFDLTEKKTESESTSDEILNTPPTPDSLTAAPQPPKPSKAAPKKILKSNDSDILQAQDGDTEQIQQLLKLIAETPKEDRGVDDVKLEQLITKFRSDLEEMPDLEAQYLLVLRKRILPNYQPSKQAAVKKTNKAKYEEAEEDNGEDFYADEEGEELPVAPLPPTRPVIKKSSRIAKNSQNNLLEEDQEEVIRTKTTAVPLPPISNKPVYPNLTQLDAAQSGVASTVTPAGYNSQYGNQVVHADFNPEATGGSGNKDWDSFVRMGAEQLRYKIEQTPNGRTFANEGRLRLLEMVLGNRNEAVKPIQGADKPINDFMSNEMLGLAAFLDEVATPDLRTRSTNALFRFDEGLMELRKVCPIKLRRVQLISDWDAYGCFLPRHEDCHAGELIKVYMELENPTVRRNQKGLNVSATISYEIRDASAKVLCKSDPSSVGETTVSPKHDYCIELDVQLPEKIPPGTYQLRINVTDMNDEAMPYAEEQIPFKVVPVVSPEN